MENVYKIYGAYSWTMSEGKNKDALIALKALIGQVRNRIITELKGKEIKIVYNRLRATAGSLLIDGIVSRIKESDAIIFDITGFNPNVMLELGIALEASRRSRAKVFIICQGNDFKNVNVPSDLAGYFISLYENKRGEVKFHDSNSLAMRIVSEIADKFEKSFFNDEN